MNAEQGMFGVVDSESSFLLAAASSLHFVVLALVAFRISTRATWRRIRRAYRREGIPLRSSCKSYGTVGISITFILAAVPARLPTAYPFRSMGTFCRWCHGRHMRTWPTAISSRSTPTWARFRATPDLRDLTPHCTSRTFANEIDEGEGRVQALTPASRGSSTPTAADVPDRKSTASLWKGAASRPSTDPLSCQEMQERLYESGSCVQKSCANSIIRVFL